MSPKKILIVDDNKVILRALSYVLKSDGYEVLTAEDGATAVSSIRSKRPDLILLDIGFPPDVGHGGGVSWDGFLIIDWVKRLEQGIQIPIFIITGEDPAKHRARAEAAGAARFFQKPINNDELRTAVHEVLGPPTPPPS